jgi:hypothetical protein
MDVSGPCCPVIHRVIIKDTMALKMIAHMPGAGGNFLTRVLEQSLDEHPIVGAQYHQEGRTPRMLSWPFWEMEWVNRPDPRHYHHNHDTEPCWLRITVTDQAEWDWACANALWKNSDLQGQSLASDPRLPAKHLVSLRCLWSWDELSKQLAGIQSRPINQHQHSLWQQWNRTWCPYAHDSRWKYTCDQRWGHLRPAYITQI